MSKEQTVYVETPDPPVWVRKNRAAVKAWGQNLNWRCMAGSATSTVYRRYLLQIAERDYAKEVSDEHL